MTQRLGRFAKQAMRDALGSLPLWACRRLVRRDVIGVLYHAVSDETLPHVEALYRYKTPEAFRADLTHLEEHYALPRWEDVFTDDAVQRRMRRPSALISFDDGFAECFHVVRPMLLERGFPCAFFIATDMIDNRDLMYRNKAALCIERLRALSPDDAGARLRVLREQLGARADTVDMACEWIKSLRFAEEHVMDAVCTALEVDVPGYLRERRPHMTTEQIRRLHDDGFTIGAHTRRHPWLGHEHDAALVEAEIVESCRIIHELTGQRSVPFAFPHSADHVDRGMLRDLRRRYAFIGPMFDTRGVGTDIPFIHNRIPADTPGPDPRQSNLPTLITRAYQRELRQRVDLPRGQRPWMEPMATF